MISHSLTWPSEGLWPVPRWCLLFGSCVLVLHVPISVIWSQQLTDDFRVSLVGAICEKRVISHTTVSRTKSCMVQTHSMATINQEIGNPSNALKRKNTNLGSGSWVTYPMQTGVGATAKPKEWVSSWRTAWWVRQWRAEQ